MYLHLRSVLLQRPAEPVPIVYIPSYTLMQMPGQSLYETMIPVKTPWGRQCLPAPSSGCMILTINSILGMTIQTLGTSVSPSPILWMRDTNHQLHPRDMKSMTHINKWVLTVHTKSRTDSSAQQVIP